MCSAGVLVWLFIASVVLPGGCSLDKGGLPGGASCESDADCVGEDDGSPCTDERCVSNRCQHVQNGFLPDDQDDCTADSCDSGKPTHDVASAKGRKCGSQGTLTCDGNGKCGGCTETAQCPLSTACRTWTCDLSTSFCEPKNALPGTPAVDLMEGDCKGQVCDGNGATKDNLAPVGTACSENGGTFCDSMGSCVKCLTTGDCTTGNCKKCDGATCGADIECVNPHCVDKVCCATVCSGVCQACGSTGQCASVPRGQGDTDTCAGGGSACDGAGACKTKDGFPCTGDVECASGACAGGLCRLPINDPCKGDKLACATNYCPGGLCAACSVAADCPGSKCAAPTCLSTLGAPCSLDGDCVGGKCRNSLCRGDIGDVCSTDAVCVTGHCDLVANQCQPCTGSADCTGLLKVCEAVNGVMTCLLQTNAYCVKNAQCATHMCVGFPGHCT